MFLQRPPSRPEPTPDPVPLALRAATLGVIAAALLGVLLFRLWALQVLHSDQYVASAAQDSVRTISVPAPRGEILDRNGHVLVGTGASIAVQVDAGRLPDGADCAATVHDLTALQQKPGCMVLNRLAWVLNVPYPRMWRQFSHLAKANPGYPVTLPFSVNRRETAYVLERRWRFPGVQFEHVYQRTYPTLAQFGPINPNLIGFVGAITAQNLKDSVLPRAAADDRHRRPGGRREDLRPLPARPGRPDPGDGRPHRGAGRCGVSDPVAGRRRQPAPDHRRAPSTDGPAGGAEGHLDRARRRPAG